MSSQTYRHKDTILTRGQIQGFIADGCKLIIVGDQVLKVDAWLPYHPGGQKAVLHMVGRDATSEIRAFHSRETQRSMLKYQIGRVQGQWKDFVPPIQGGTYKSKPEHFWQQELSSPSYETLRTHHPVANEPSEIISSSLPPKEQHTISKQGSFTDKTILYEVQRDLEVYPSLDCGTQADIVRRYKQLDQNMRNIGLYRCDYSAYLFDAFRYVSLGILSYYCLIYGRYALSGIFLGMLWHQLVFVVHDAGHMGITHNFHIDSCIGMFIANFLGGLSCSWWKTNHNVHHIVTNSAEHDPDIQYMPFFAVTPKFFKSLKSSFYECVMWYDTPARYIIKYQHYLYYFVLMFGRFNLYFLSWQYTLLGQGPRKGPARWHRYFELIGQLVFWYWFGYITVYISIPTNWNRFVFVMLSHAVQMPLHVQLTLSHFAMSTSDLGVSESFPQRMLRTTMDISCPKWLDFFHGGLQFQTVHHLFPRLPRHNLRKAQEYDIKFCEAVDIPYTVYGFQDGNKKVLSRLEEVAQQARILADCQRSIAMSNSLRS